jgi:hypothetical protein
MKETNSAADDPIMTIGRYRIRKSRLKAYLENIAAGAEFNLFDNPRSNKTTDTWIKNNIGRIVKAVGSLDTK